MPIQCNWCGRWWDAQKLTTCPECGEPYENDDDEPDADAIYPAWIAPVSEDELEGNTDIDELIDEIIEENKK